MIRSEIKRKQNKTEYKSQQSAPSAQSGKLLRSVTKPKMEKPPTPSSTADLSSASKRGRSAAASKSVSVLDLSSGKDRSAAKPPARRLSVPDKVAAPRAGGSVTPVSEARRRSVRIETPVSASSSRLTTSRKKFFILSSQSYWLSQIKLSEAAGKHSVSLGFFKLALEAGCKQPLLQMRDELKAYALRHKIGDVADLSSVVKELFESYGVVENEQMQVSETCSHVPEEGAKSSDEDAKSTTSSMGARKLKPKSLNTSAVAAPAQVTPVENKPKKKEVPQKGIPAPAKTRASAVKKSSASGPDSATQKPIAKKPQKPIKQEAKKEKIPKKQEKSAAEQGSDTPTSVEAALHENKENKDAVSMEEISLTEVA